MNQRCSSIYREDYRWPEVKPQHVRAELGCEIAAPRQEPCSFEKPEKPEIRETRCPGVEQIVFDDTDACLKKLFRKNPELLRLMRTKPSLDGLAKFNVDRFTTTYQCDYEHKGVPPVDFDGLPTKRVPCPLEDYQPPVYDCRVNKKHPSAILRAKKGLPPRGAEEPCRHGRPGRAQGQEEETRESKSSFPQAKLLKIPEAKYTPWNSEYREEINRKGNFIMNMLKKRKQSVVKKGPERKTAIY